MSWSEEEESPPAINAPRIVVVLLGLLLAIHVLRTFLSESTDILLLLWFSFIPARYGGGDPSIPAEMLPGGLGADIWTFFTHALLHGDWVHLAMNSLFLLAFGSAVARRVSAASFVLFCGLCAAAGAAAMLIFNWGLLVPVIGASGAVAGVFAAAMRLLYSGQAIRTGGAERPVASLRRFLASPGVLVFIAVWLVLNYAFGVGSTPLVAEDSRVAWEAHIGGFVAGLVLFGLFDRAGEQRSDLL